MTGAVNVENALLAAEAAVVLGVEPAVVAAGLSAAGAVPGRLEVVATPDGGAPCTVHGRLRPHPGRPRGGAGRGPATGRGRRAGAGGLRLRGRAGPDQAPPDGRGRHPPGRRGRPHLGQPAPRGPRGHHRPRSWPASCPRRTRRAPPGAWSSSPTGGGPSSGRSVGRRRRRGGGGRQGPRDHPGGGRRLLPFDDRAVVAEVLGVRTTSPGPRTRAAERCSPSWPRVGPPSPSPSWPPRSCVGGWSATASASTSARRGRPATAPRPARPTMGGLAIVAPWSSATPWPTSAPRCASRPPATW